MSFDVGICMKQKCDISNLIHKFFFRYFCIKSECDKNIPIVYSIISKLTPEGKTHAHRMFVRLVSIFLLIVLAVCALQLAHIRIENLFAEMCKRNCAINFMMFQAIFAEFFEKWNIAMAVIFERRFFDSAFFFEFSYLAFFKFLL